MDTILHEYLLIGMCFKLVKEFCTCTFWGNNFLLPFRLEQIISTESTVHRSLTVTKVLSFSSSTFFFTEKTFKPIYIKESAENQNFLNFEILRIGLKQLFTILPGCDTVTLIIITTRIKPVTLSSSWMRQQRALNEATSVS